ncbi:ABC transporter permease [Flavonifractor plautii]|nr:ABC transporter permease [Flavonifractor plautii]
MHSSGKTPLIRLAKRDGMVSAGQWGIRIAAILLALVVGGLVILLSGNNPIQGYAIIVEGALGKTSGIRQTVKNFIPLLGTALAIAPCFKMRFWNIGAEGQITGAMCATYFALFWADSIPRCPCCSSCAPRHRRRPVGAGARLLQGPLGDQRDSVHPDDELHHHRRGKVAPGRPMGEDPRGSQQIEQFASNACLPRVVSVYCGWVVVLALTVFMFIYMKYTKHGYEIAVIGESENTARYAGMNVGWVIMRTMFLSGAIAGVVGFLLVSGANNTLYSGVAAGAGFTAITVAWLAQLNPFAMVGISALLAILQKGADTLNTQMGIPTSLSDVITGVLLFFMLGCEFFINYKLVFRGAEERHKRKEAAK